MLRPLYRHVKYVTQRPETPQLFNINELDIENITEEDIVNALSKRYRTFKRGKVEIYSTEDATEHVVLNDSTNIVTYLRLRDVNKIELTLLKLPDKTCKICRQIEKSSREILNIYKNVRIYSKCTLDMKLF